MTSNLDSSVGDRRRSRAYLNELVAGVAGYIVLTLAAGWLTRGLEHSPARQWVALLPIVAAVWMAVAVLRHLRRVDEFQRLQTLEGLGVGFVVAMLTALSLGFLAPFGLTVSDAVWWVYAAGMLGWIATRIAQRLR